MGFALSQARGQNTPHLQRLVPPDSPLAGAPNQRNSATRTFTCKPQRPAEVSADLQFYAATPARVGETGQYGHLRSMVRAAQAPSSSFAPDDRAVVSGWLHRSSSTSGTSPGTHVHMQRSATSGACSSGCGKSGGRLGKRCEVGAFLLFNSSTSTNVSAFQCTKLEFQQVQAQGDGA